MHPSHASLSLAHTLSLTHTRAPTLRRTTHARPPGGRTSATPYYVPWTRRGVLVKTTLSASRCSCPQLFSYSSFLSHLLPLLSSPFLLILSSHPFVLSSILHRPDPVTAGRPDRETSSPPPLSLHGRFHSVPPPFVVWCTSRLQPIKLLQLLGVRQFYRDGPPTESNREIQEAIK